MARLKSIVDLTLCRDAEHSTAATITVDHGTEFTSRALDEWAFRRGVELDFIRPGKPIENALIELWRQDYNRNRPHGALGNLTPIEYAQRGQEDASEGAEFQLKICLVSGVRGELRTQTRKESKS
jgi:transposase InsO family protein